MPDAGDPFSWIFKAIASDQSWQISMRLLLTAKCLPPAGSWWVISNFSIQMLKVRIHSPFTSLTTKRRVPNQFKPSAVWHRLFIEFKGQMLSLFIQYFTLNLSMAKTTGSRFRRHFKCCVDNTSRMHYLWSRVQVWKVLRAYDTCFNPS